MSINETASQFLSQITLGDILTSKETTPEIISADLDMTLENVLSLMKKHDIIAVFVKENNSYITVVEILDIVNHVIFLPYIAYVKDGEVSFEKFHFSGETIGSLLKTRNLKKGLLCASLDTPLSKVIQFFSRNGNYHQGIAQSPDNKTFVFSQADIIKYLFDNSDKMLSLMNSRIEDLNMANPFGKPPVNINVHESAFQAFLQLCTEKVRALAVLNDQGQVVGTLSASDLRGFDSEQLPKLNKPILEFAKEVGGGYTPVTVHSRVQLNEVLLKLVRSKPRIHRVWVTNTNQEPIGVITLSDILSLFCRIVPS